LLLDIRDRPIVIIGGGEVAVRKVEGLLAAGAKHVRVVAAKFHDAMPGDVERVEEMYRREHLSGAQLVFAATDDPAVNEAVVRDAHELGLLVCRADSDENTGDFTTPAMIRREPLLVTVSTGGSPALAAKIRDQIERAIDPRWITMAQFLQSLRPRIRSHPSLAPSRRREIFRALASDESIERLATAGEPAMIQWLSEKFPELAEILRA
jgi:precorrin-2 dehydrogenase/sirohydrochlorin ferrochelatase